MKLTTYNKVRWIVLGLVIVGVTGAVMIERAVIALMSVFLGMVVMSLLKVKVKGVLVDERAMDIGGRTAMSSFRVLMPVLGLTSLMFVMVGKAEYYYVKALGIILSYVICLGLVIYMAAYYYYEKKMGGSD